MIQIIPSPHLEAKDIKYLRSICKKSIAEIKEASKNGTPIREIEIFKTEWDDEKIELVNIYRYYTRENSPACLIKEVNKFGLNEVLTPDKLKTRILLWRGIELETEMHTELELGEIADPEHFQPSSEDWT